MQKTQSISVTVTPTVNDRFQLLCDYWNLSKSRCIEELINRQYFELKYKENLDIDKIREEQSQ